MKQANQSLSKLCALVVVCAGVWLGGVSIAFGDITTYFNDFETTVGPEWSSTLTDVTPLGGRKYLGQFNNTDVFLRLTNLPPHSSIRLSFDLYIINSWDGNGDGTGPGPDIWELAVSNGPVLLHTTFGSRVSAGTQAFPDNYPATHTNYTGASEIGTLGYTNMYPWPPVDSVYHLMFNITNEANSITLRFTGSGLQGYWGPGIWDESWGLDNVKVEAIGTTVNGGLVAYYRLNGNTKDASGNGNDGTANGGGFTADWLGRTNSAYHFDGNSEIDVPNSSSLKVGGRSITMAAWVYPTQFSGTGNRRTILRKMYAGGSAGGYLFALSNDGYPHIGFIGNTYYEARCATTLVPLSNWSHVAVTYDGVSARFYVNGILMESIAQTNGIAVDDTPLCIGCLSSVSALESFYGNLDEICLYDRALSGPEILQLASSGLDYGLVAHYRFNGNANDATLNGNNGAANGGSFTSDWLGRANSAYSFDGNCEIDVSNSPSLKVGGTAITMTAWVNPTQFSGSANRRTILRKMDQAGSTGGYLFALSNEGFPHLGFIGGTYYEAKCATTAVPISQWSHVAVTYDGISANFYVNGFLKESIPQTHSIAIDDAALCIGRLSPTFPTEEFYGKLDEIRIYGRTLSTLEVWQLYNYDSGTAVTLMKAVRPVFSYLLPGSDYQLQVSGDFNNWKNHGAPFTATNSTMLYPQYWDVDNWGGLFFRLIAVP
jgi:hypothetical protein